MENLQEVIQAGINIGDTKVIPSLNIPYAVVPQDSQLVMFDDMMPTPLDIKASVTTYDAASFISYFNQFKTANSRIFASQESLTFTGVLDYHQAGTDGQPAQPHWGRHTVSFHCPVSKEWSIWTQADGQKMRQAEFAEFIEDNLPDIVSPAGADMLAVTRTLEAKKNVNFASGVRLDNGETQLVYEETIQGTAAKGTLQIPEKFVLGIRAINGGEPYKLEARLRYRINNGDLYFWYDLLRPHKIIEDAFRAALNQIAQGTAIEIWQGSL